MKWGWRPLTALEILEHDMPPGHDWEVFEITIGNWRIGICARCTAPGWREM